MVGKPAPKSIDYNSLKYIASYGVGVGGNRRLHGERLIAPPPSAGTGEPRLRLSSEEVVRVVGARYIRFATEQEDDDSFGGTMLSALTMEETQDVELARLILLAADKVGNKEYDRADRLLSYYDRSASATGNPVQRVVHHFVGALRENRVGDGDEGEDNEEAGGQHVQVVPTTTGHHHLLPPPSLPPNQMA